MKVVTLSRLPPSARFVLEQIASFRCVERLILFGSRAIGDHEPRSDIDVALVSSTAAPSELILLKALADEGPSLYWISVHHFESMPSALQSRVLETGALLYERKKTEGQHWQSQPRD